MNKIVIIDDSLANLERLTTLLSSIDLECELTVLNTYESALVFFKENIDFDILFLDIEIGDKNGFDLIPIIQNADYNLIVTTGHAEYAIDAIRNSAIDFLLKPIDIEELKNAVSRVLIKVDSKLKIKNLLSNMSITESQKRTILLKTNNSLQAYKFEDIVRCQADVNYTLIYLSNNSKIIISKTLKEVDKTFSCEGFFRIHKSHLINLNYFKKYIPNTNEVILQDDTSLPLSLSRKDLFITNFLKL